VAKVKTEAGVDPGGVGEVVGGASQYHLEVGEGIGEAEGIVGGEAGDLIESGGEAMAKSQQERLAVEEEGLSTREEFALSIYCALLRSQPQVVPSVSIAVGLADELLAELGK
jgi:hypothetical protein